MLVETMKRHRYAGKLHEVGDEYDLAGRRHVKLLEVVGRICRVPERIAALPKEEPKDVALPKEEPKDVAEGKVVKEKSAKKKSMKKKRKANYKNKNMVSE